MSREARRTDTVGVIDIGSNSVRLLVARTASGRTDVVFSDLITSRLLSGAKAGVLNGDSIERTVAAIKSLISRARELGAQKIIAFGTCAMREGVNSAVIVNEIRSRENVAIEILSGENEADIAYMGVCKEGKTGVLDIGGGSTEFTIGENKTVLRGASAHMGAVRLYESAPASNPDELVLRAKQALIPAWEAVKSENAPAWTGVGGTVTTLAAMTLELPVYDADKVTGFDITREKAREWLDRLFYMTVQARAALPGIKANRADIIPFGAAILEAFFELSGARFITAADNDNMLGYLKFKSGLF